jgi:hypothetical protein
MLALFSLHNILKAVQLTAAMGASTNLPEMSTVPIFKILLSHFSMHIEV